MRRRALLLPLFFSVSLMVIPTLSAKDKTKTASSDKIRQDFSKFVDIPGAEKIGEEQCAACHADLSKTYRRSGHAMQEVACEQCHGAGSLHVAAGGYSTESKADNTIWNSPNYRPNVNGKLQSYSVFFGRVW